MESNLMIGTRSVAGIAAMPFAKALKYLRKAEQQSGNGSADSTAEMTLLLDRSEVVLLQNIFQHRCGDTNSDDRRRQVRELAKALRSKPAEKRALDPILVKEIDGVLVCIDGHHRMAAYAQTGVNTVPAVLFAGSVDDALVAASETNRKTKLSFTGQDSREAAWRLTVAGQASKRQLRQATGVSDGTIANMRRALSQLLQDGQEPSEFSWERAKMELRGTALPERDDEWKAQRIEDFERRLTQQFGRIHKSRDIFAEALENVYPSLVEAIIQRNVICHRDTVEMIFREHDEESDDEEHRG